MKIYLTTLLLLTSLNIYSQIPKVKITNSDLKRAIKFYLKEGQIKEKRGLLTVKFDYISRRFFNSSDTSLSFSISIHRHTHFFKKTMDPPECYAKYKGLIVLFYTKHTLYIHQPTDAIDKFTSKLKEYRPKGFIQVKHTMNLLVTNGNIINVTPSYD